METDPNVIWAVGAAWWSLVVVAIAASIAIYDRLRRIHHSLRNIEHFAKKLAGSKYTDSGPRDEPAAR